MNVKTDTKEKFTVIHPGETALSVNMTEELSHLLLTYLQKDIPHVILSMENVASIDEEGGAILVAAQQKFYEHNCSFVICNLQKKVEEMLDGLDLLELMNVTPTESEAWDIVQMEEIERELLNGEEG